MKKIKSYKGFSLIEMLITITIMGIIMSVMVVEYGGYIDKSEIAVAKHEISQIVQVIDMAISTKTAFINRESDKIDITDFDQIQSGNEISFIYEKETGTLIDGNTLDIDNETKTIAYTRGKVTVIFDYLTRQFIDD